MSDTEDWEITAVPSKPTNGTRTFQVWKGKWRSSLYPNLWGYMEALIEDDPKTDYTSHAFISSKGWMPQEETKISINVTIQSRPHGTELPHQLQDATVILIGAQHQGYTVWYTAKQGFSKTKKQVCLNGKYRCAKPNDKGKIKLFLSSDDDK